MLETMDGTIDAVSASITFTRADGSTVKMDLPLKEGVPTFYEFDVDRKEEDISSWWTPILVSSVSTVYQELRLTLPMCAREEGTFFTVTDANSDAVQD